MIIFNVDMDNTIIYSYKHDIGMEKRCAEIYQGREISFMTHKTEKMLKEIAKEILVVPTTTRTKEQYERIRLGLDEIPYALVCNGGILLKNGAEDEAWYQESLNMIQESNEELEKAERLLEADEDVCFEIRNIRGLFIFTKSNRPEESVKKLSDKLNASLVDVFNNGVKVYVVPKKLTKGNAVSRLKALLNAEKVIAAGDSEFDISMLQCADMGIAPEELEMEEKNKNIFRVKRGILFSEGVLEYVAMKIQKG